MLISAQKRNKRAHRTAFLTIRGVLLEHGMCVYLRPAEGALALWDSSEVALLTFFVVLFLRSWCAKALIYFYFTVLLMCFIFICCKSRLTNTLCSILTGLFLSFLSGLLFKTNYPLLFTWQRARRSKFCRNEKHWKHVIPSISLPDFDLYGHYKVFETFGHWSSEV